MQRKFLLLLSIMALVVVLTLPQVVSAQMGGSPGMMGNPGRMGSPGRMGNPGGNPNMRNDAQIIHQLFAYHNQVNRTVKQLPDGIQAVTGSDDPHVAALIQAHVASMYQRIANKQPIPMMHMAPTVPTLLQNGDRYQRTLKNTAQGVTVTEIASDPNLIKIIREHAREVDAFVKAGMSPGMGGMMN